MTANDHGHINNLDQKQLETLKKYWISLTTAIHSDSSQLLNSKVGEELFYLFGKENPDVALLRWLRARKWDVPSAVQFLLDALEWRQEWNLRGLMAKGEGDLVQEECASSKMYYMGKDRVGRPVTYSHAKEHIRGEYPMEMTEKFVILSMETGKDFVQSPIEEGTVVLDMANITLKNLDYQHIKFMINAMQNYYPECLGLALVVNAPWTFNAVWSMIRSWLDPVVESKIRFVKRSADLAEYIDPAMIPRRLEGTQTDFEYIPPSKEDLAHLTLLRSDQQGMKKAQVKHREVGQYYLDVTLKWASSNDIDKKEQLKLERSKAAQHLRDAYEQLIPYISTQTHYHRKGAIQEPIFDTVYNRISSEDTETAHL